MSNLASSLRDNSVEEFKGIHKLSRQEGGFRSQSQRSELWPKIVGVNRYNSVNYKGFISILRHRDYSQVQCDIDRSLWHFSHVLSWSDNVLNRSRQDLSEIVLAILTRNSNLYYYQGLHDFIAVFLLTFNDDYLAFAVAEVVCNEFMSDFMCEDFRTVSKLMNLILDLIGVVDKQLYQFLRQASIEPFFATSWMLTWFSHDIHNLEAVGRVFDALLCSPPPFILYMCAAVVLHYRTSVLECECDFASVHSLLTNITGRSRGRGLEQDSTEGTSPSPSLDDDEGTAVPLALDAIIRAADNLMRRAPPWMLRDLADAELRDLIDEGSVHMLRSFCEPNISRPALSGPSNSQSPPCPVRASSQCSHSPANTAITGAGVLRYRAVSKWTSGGQGGCGWERIVDSEPCMRDLLREDMLRMGRTRHGNNVGVSRSRFALALTGLVGLLLPSPSTLDALVRSVARTIDEGIVRGLLGGLVSGWALALRMLRRTFYKVGR